MGKNLYDIVSFDSYNSLCEASVERDFDVFGIADEYNNKYEAIVLPDGLFVCGLMYYDSGIKPQIILQGNSSLLFLGFDKIVVCLNYLTKQILVEKEFLSLFYDFIDVKLYKLIIIVSELDVCAINYNGKMVWSLGFKDVVEDFHLYNNNKLFVKCADGNESVLSITDGSFEIKD